MLMLFTAVIIITTTIIIITVIIIAYNHCRWFRYITEASENYKHLQGITDKSITPSCLKGYMSGNNVVTTGGQEAETVQPSGVLPLLSSSISSIIPDDVAHLKVAKIDPSLWVDIELTYVWWWRWRWWRWRRWWWCWWWWYDYWGRIIDINRWWWM